MVSSQIKNLISQGAVLSNSKSIYIFTVHTAHVFNKVLLNKSRAVSKTLSCSMVYLDGLFLKFCDTVAH